jgi:hypothetical protein
MGDFKQFQRASGTTSAKTGVPILNLSLSDSETQLPTRHLPINANSISTTRSPKSTPKNRVADWGPKEKEYLSSQV